MGQKESYAVTIVAVVKIKFGSEHAGQRVKNDIAIPSFPEPFFGKYQKETAQASAHFEGVRSDFNKMFSPEFTIKKCSHCSLFGFPVVRNMGK